MDKRTIITGRRADLERKAASIMAELMRDSIVRHDRAVCAVPGGRSVENVLRRLEHELVDWHKVHFFMVDERLVPAGHPDSNFRLLASCVWSFVDTGNLHPFPQPEAGSDAALASYNRLLGNYGGHFDLVLLSSGEDGHIASLFPEHETVFSDAPLFIQTSRAPKPPPARVSASKHLICSSRAALLLFFGAGKRKALDSYLDEQVGLQQCPAKIVGLIPRHYVLTDLEIER